MPTLWNFQLHRGPIKVIYDRADSVAAQLTPTDVDWDFLLDTRLLHLTGTRPRFRLAVPWW